MTIQLLPQLVNDPFGDPAVYLQIRHEKTAVLFDLGELYNLPTKKLMKIDYVFVSHCHIDHFIGFDRLLRCTLNRPKTIYFFGPEGFLAHVRGKLAGYTWNLVGSYPLVIRAAEIHHDYLYSTTFYCHDGFRDQPIIKEKRHDNFIMQQTLFSVRATLVDHKIPCVAYRLEEPFHLNFRREVLQRENWPRGPWLSELRRAIKAKASKDRLFYINNQWYKLADLQRRLTIITPGQIIGYASDFSASAENFKKLTKLFQDCDTLFCEAAFLDIDRERAFQTCHLTASQAATLAQQANAKKLVLFHFSPKNHGLGEKYYQEARQVFGGQLI